jgi:phospholipase C
MAFAEGVEHIVVLMFENRSFDHMIGYLPGVNGVDGTQFNLDSSGKQWFVSTNAQPAGLLDPSHAFTSVQQQIAPPPPLSAMGGFVINYVGLEGGSAADIMSCFNSPAGQPPVLTQLASQFTVCDQWFSSVPGPTWPNRYYIHAATSGGLVTNDYIADDTRTIYQNIDEAGLSWNIYFGDIPQSLTLGYVRSQILSGRIKPLDDFVKDVNNNTLANYVFIEPRYFSLAWWLASDQHPPHDVLVGDQLIGSIYNTLANSSIWNNTVLVILWDEHGGIYDHVPPLGTVNPDGLNSPLPSHPTDPPFDFTLLGVRTPAVIVSPLVSTGVDSTIYDHSSALATAKEIFGLPSFLTKRDANANTFTHLLSRANLRETPAAVLPEMPWESPLAPMSAEAAAAPGAPVSTSPLTDNQQSLVRLAQSLDIAETPHMRAIRNARPLVTEADAAQYVSDATMRVLGLDRP